MFDKTIFFKNNEKAEAFRTTSVFSANIQVKAKNLKYIIYKSFDKLVVMFPKSQSIQDFGNLKIRLGGLKNFDKFSFSWGNLQNFIRVF